MKDLRKLIKETYDQQDKMPEGHEDRFLARLERELPEKRTGKRFWSGGPGWKIAASLLIIVGITIAFYETGKNRAVTEDEPAITDVSDPEDRTEQISLGDLSPDLKKVENYYVTTINWELSRMEVDETNRQLFDGYMQRLAELNEEYQTLNRELNDVGPNEQTVIALIDNLKMRLQLLYRLKDKLQELKSRNNEKTAYLQV
ncbi:hypothetical protein [Sinomicrobium weinanense]|uniref:Uncharacterized protein n=1 Tax=Sinomicrobium weinanense TaxID=2842200 RepID=A0A926JSC7_9FLAO|nr:hypothetical protein [Sinomicrobium weinanense]MBC9796588.1 hypothetical protein [Sinomicrobium weinanense]MBU3123572.1 hypothetical protein [Sinomicrobium weinanense]